MKTQGFATPLERLRDVDVAVIGGGPAGLAAALGASRAGAEVVILERGKRLGGILNQCIHDGFGLALYKESISGPEYAERLMDDVGREGIRVETGAMVLDLSADKILRVNSRSGYSLVRAKSVVLAMGCRERTRDMIEIPGDRPAGVWTAGTAQNLVNLQNLRLGNEIVILGSGDIGLIMARRLTFEGMKVKGVFEILPWVGGLERNVRQCLSDFSIPLELTTTVVDICGRDRLSSVVVSRVDEALKPLAGTEREIPCDTLLLSVGLIPENELSKRAGVELSPATGGAVVDEMFMTSVPGVFSCGNVLQIHDVADWASFEGFVAGKNAALHARGEIPTRGTIVRITPGAGVRYALPQIVRRSAAGVDLHFRVTAPRRNVWIEARGSASGTIFFRRKFPRLLPSELQKIKLTTAIDEDLEVAAHD
ncbi:MAG: FAD-dependent oxidoreductase [Candidatus Aminicenantes bacterium]|nr:FAD-dependent oxidoreductase [Candidatus Aminicenantes bacterium]